jgi:PEP-CTERM motif
MICETPQRMPARKRFAELLFHIRARHRLNFGGLMSTGPFVTGLAAALVVGVSVVSAASDDKTPKARQGSHEVAASTFYSATFSHGAMCASGSTRASRQTLSNPFGSFNGAGSYAANFFRAGFNAGFSARQAASHGLMSMPSNGRSSSNRGSGVVTLPGPARQGGITTALAHGTPAVGAGAERVSGLDAASPSATPEPATLLFLTTGIAGVFVARRRRSRTSN